MVDFFARLCPFLLVALLLTSSPHSAAFGRLLTSPAERVQLDRQRNGSELVSASVQATPARQYVSLEGVVSRQNGPASIWINGQLQDKPRAHTGADRQGKAGIDVVLPASQGSIRLQPGQLLHLDNGELHDAYLGDASVGGPKQGAVLEGPGQGAGLASPAIESP
ncbi:hypothetical protein A9Q90_08485 [Gammaproteobacteria bacterium 54_18_T64]|nr:hypothetical protein A9Q90_08485 [Gammaproteobacteria bacterium 54_18_T64]